MAGSSGFTDIHCHILPGIDDGAQNIEDSRALLEAEVAEGVTTIIATPHFDMEENLQSIDVIKEKLVQVQELASEISDELQIYCGCEILFSQGILDLIREGKVPTMADTKYVLVEFYPSESFDDIYHAMREIVLLGKIPILAHVERYECFIAHEERIKELIELGCYIQMNARSLLGGLFDKRTRFCKSAVKHGLIHFMATDCHNIRHRPPKMRQTYDMIEKIAGHRTAEALTSGNAGILLGGKYI